MLLGLIVGISMVKAAKFNSSITIVVDGWSPMISTGAAYTVGGNGSVQRKTEVYQSVDALFFNWYFVGTEYSASGTIQPGSGSVYDGDLPLGNNMVLGTDPNRLMIYFGPSERNSTGLGHVSDLPLRPYTVALKPEGDAQITFDSLSYSVPVLTQA